MSRPNSRLSSHEETRLAFEGVLDLLGATGLRAAIEEADKAMDRTEQGLDGIFVAIGDEALGGDDIFATTVQIDREGVSVVFGGDTESYHLPRAEVSELIAQRLQTEETP